MHPLGGGLYWEVIIESLGDGEILSASAFVSRVEWH
jgi:hypothetical protein